MSEQRVFGAVIIGDEILSGKRQDKHFERIAAMLGERGLRLSWVEYLGDERQRLAETFRRTLASGDVVFSCGGIGNTPDDHTRQAAAAALGVGLEIHPEGVEEAKIRFGDDMTPQRLQLVTFPAGAGIIPNPFNRIPGFMAREHYFVPGFPQMAHPMIEWVLDSFYKDLFQPAAAKVDKAFLLTGPT
ncbi:MAG TPA: competence/damage-inducible protein A, partial [Rhodocyclaceae bacterium]|nr:competence/damage-inducible protein A [Rhodocyclaceae bacterium]